MLMFRCKMRHDDGYVLLIVLVFLQVLSCLGLYELISLSTSLRINEHRWLHEAHLIQAKRTLAGIEQKVLTGNVACFIPVVAAAALAAKPIEWWQQHACSSYLANDHYYYVAEALASDACAEVDYYRITLLYDFANMKTPPLILQSTLAKPSDDHLSCIGKTHQVALGRQMIREIF